jgi:hypothetical protein
MSDTERASSDEIKVAVRELRGVLTRLPQNPHTDNAERALDTVRDHAMRSLEQPPDPNER